MNGLKVTSNGIGKYLSGMIDRTEKVQGWLNRVAYPYLLNMQRTRWQTENSALGEKWEPIKSESYVTYKLKKFRDYPGGGRKLLIATDRLRQSMTGENQAEHYKLVTKNKLEMGSMVPYAQYVEETRDILSIPKFAMDELSKSLGEYLKGSK